MATTQPLLKIDLGAVAENYAILKQRAGRAVCAAVVKDDAYGLGAAQVARVLRDAGCHEFFVATPEEGAALRRELPREEQVIFVLNGPLSGQGDFYLQHRLTPVLNSLAEVDYWRGVSSGQGRALPAALHVDTGMNRLGLPPDELKSLAEDRTRLSGISLALIMSHLACAATPDHPLNAQQLESFNRALAMLPAAPASLSSSSGIFLDEAYHFDLVRPGVALYGGAPLAGRDNPMRPVLGLEAPVLQVRDAPAGSSVGYGATHRFDRPARVATLGIGYAGGFFRALGNRANVYFRGRPAPVVGRISMDLVTVDVTSLGEDAPKPGDVVEILGKYHRVDDLAEEAGTISYEIMTGLGQHFQRRYIDVAMEKAESAQ